MGKTVGCGCDYCMSNGVRKDFRHDHGSDGFTDTPHRKSAKPKPKRKSRQGCDGNDGGPHVYVWTTFYDIYGYDLSYNYYEYKVCVGCRRRPRRGIRRRTK